MSKHSMNSFKPGQIVWNGSPKHNFEMSVSKSGIRVRAAFQDSFRECGLILSHGPVNTCNPSMHFYHAAHAHSVRVL